MADLTAYLPMVGIVSTLMLSIILITYLASKALKVPEWEAYLSIELYELVISFVVLILAVGFYEGMNAAATGWLGVPSTTTAASVFLERMVQDGVLPGMLDAFSLQGCFSIWNMFHRRPGEFVLTVSYKVFPGIDSLISALNVIAFGLTAVYGSLSVQLMALQIVDTTMINFFLPAGIVLRFFPPTREAGAFLISFAVGFGIIFPATYVINEKVMTDMGINVYDAPTFRVPWICGARFPILGFVGSRIVNLVGGTSLVSTVYTVVFSELGLNFMTPLEFSRILESLAALSLPAFFLPAFSISVTISFISAMTKFILTKM